DELDATEVVRVEDAARPLEATATEQVAHDARDRHRPEPDRCDHVETLLELGERGRVQRPRADVGVRVHVRDDRERRSSQAAHLERGVEPPAPPEERAGDDAGEGEVSRAPALATPPERVDPPDDLRVEADA